MLLDKTFSDGEYKNPKRKKINCSIGKGKNKFQHCTAPSISHSSINASAPSLLLYGTAEGGRTAAAVHSAGRGSWHSWNTVRDTQVKRTWPTSILARLSYPIEIPIDLEWGCHAPLLGLTKLILYRGAVILWQKEKHFVQKNSSLSLFNDH